MAKAPSADQHRLLEVQALDTKIDRALHRRDNLEAAARLEQLAAQRGEAAGAAAQTRAALGDVERELARVEEDVAMVVARRARDRERLDEGFGHARDLVALQHEVATLDRRLSNLEDSQLEVMERLEDAGHLADAAAQVVAKLDEEVAALEVRVAEAYAEIDAEVAGLRAERGSAADGLAAPLMALYERLRASRGGIGAAPIRAKRCEGCRLELTPAELEYIRAASPDEIIRCEECGRILVRLEDSGL